MSHSKEIRVKKDGFWAWAICFSSLVNNAVVYGTDESFGIIIGSIIKDLDSNAHTISWIKSIHSTTLLLFASISPVLTQKYGFRLVIIMGVVLSCIAYLCAVIRKSFFFSS